MKISILLVAQLLAAPTLYAQQALPAATTAPQATEQPAPQTLDKAWSLGQCIDYAVQNNISVQQQALQVEQNQVQLSTSRLSRLPNVGASAGFDASFGRALAQDNVYINTNQQSGSLGLSAGIPIFEGLRINKQIKGSKLNLEAAKQDLDRAREDLSINIMTLYLQALYTKEMVGVAERQLALSAQQTERSREQVATGKKPESALYESEALQAGNRLSLTQARNDQMLALLNLSQALNRESAEGFDVATPTLDSLSLAALHQLGSAQATYDYAVEYRPHIRAERLRMENRLNDIAIARSAFYPSISLSGGYSTGVYVGADLSFGQQFRANSREYVGLSMSVPIFNRMATRNNVRSAKLSLRNQQLALTAAEQALRKEIEQAWYNADAAYSKYRSAEAALSSARVAFDYEQQRANAGRSTIFDFNDAKTRMEKAEAELVQSKYEFVFRSKILDFYRGIPIRL